MMNDTDMSQNGSDQIRQHAMDWVIRLASGRATVADGEAFRRWCGQSAEHARAFSECRQNWLGMQQAAQREAAAAPEPRHDNVTPINTARLTRRALLGGALAASVGWLAVRPPLRLWPSVYDISADYHTDTGQQREIALSQQVQLHMNTQTSIDIYRRQGALAGITLQSGETEVIARPGGEYPFEVLADNGRIQATDARFNVRYIDRAVCVTCLAGQLTVEHSDRSVRLLTNQQISYDHNGMLPVAAADAAQITAWRRRMLVFNNTPLVQVIDEINRYRAGKVILMNSELGKNLVQAQLSVDRFTDFTSLIQQVYGANIRYLPGGVVLIS
jgi:transmembrane sensor